MRQAGPVYICMRHTERPTPTASWQSRWVSGCSESNNAMTSSCPPLVFSLIMGAVLNYRASRFALRPTDWSMTWILCSVALLKNNLSFLLLVQSRRQSHGSNFTLFLIGIFIIFYFGYNHQVLIKLVQTHAHTKLVGLRNK